MPYQKRCLPQLRGRRSGQPQQLPVLWLLPGLWWPEPASGGDTGSSQTPKRELTVTNHTFIIHLSLSLRLSVSVSISISLSLSHNRVHSPHSHSIPILPFKMRRKKKYRHIHRKIYIDHYTQETQVVGRYIHQYQERQHTLPHTQPSTHLYAGTWVYLVHHVSR